MRMVACNANTTEFTSCASCWDMLKYDLYVSASPTEWGTCFIPLFLSLSLNVYQPESTYLFIEYIFTKIHWIPSYILSELMLLALYYPLSSLNIFIDSQAVSSPHCRCCYWIPEGTQKASSFNFLTLEVPTNDSPSEKSFDLRPITTFSVVRLWLLGMVIAQAKVQWKLLTRNLKLVFQIYLSSQLTTP